MTFTESLYVALLCISIVMLVLACLFIIIKIFSFSIVMVTKRANNTNQNLLKTIVTDPNIDLEQFEDKESGVSSGELKLHHVDERTAAMIMAIVSDTSRIPLSELCFKSIKAIKNNTDESQEATK